MDSDYNPKIVGFICRWCTYMGADLAGTMRLKYEPNIIPIKLMCSGRVDPEWILKAIRMGADGVLVGGCHPGDCHYIEGNYKTLRRMTLFSRVIEQLGINPKRVRLEWISAAEGDIFMNVVNEFTQQVRELGPLQRLPNGMIVDPTMQRGTVPQAEPALVGAR